MEEKKVIKKEKEKELEQQSFLGLVLASGVGGAFLWKQKRQPERQKQTTGCRQRGVGKDHHS
ncbi:MAG: hypothetical protein ACLU8D_09045 [Enterocloster sp.]